MTDLTTKVFQVKTVREASTTRRCHILPHHGEHTIGQHSYGAVALLLILHPDPSVDLIRAVMFHDVAERWLGDMPATAKTAFPGLGAIYEEAEREVLKKLDLFPSLHMTDQWWLRAVDTLDLYLWGREQMRMGNGELKALVAKCYESLSSRHLEGNVPWEVWNYLNHVEGWPNYPRQSDVFDVALTDGLG